VVKLPREKFDEVVGKVEAIDAKRGAELEKARRLFLEQFRK
jgi:hypothetical protein